MGPGRIQVEGFLMKEHHWSGWPGAFCLDCGAEDPWEIAVGNNYYDPVDKKWATEDEVREYVERMNQEFNRQISAEEMVMDMIFVRHECEKAKPCHINYNDKCPFCNKKLRNP